MAATVFTGGRILSMDAAYAESESVVVDDGRIVAVGERALVDAHPGAAVHDLAGRTLVPGFIDAHNHLSIAALHPRWRDVSGAASLDDLLEAVRAQAEAVPESEWVRVQGWTEWDHGVFPTAADLDSLGIDRPIAVAHYSLHQCVVSSAGLDVIGFGRSTPDPRGGEIGRGDDGAPNGFLLERAWSHAHARSMAAYADPDRWAEHVVARSRVLHSEGITAVHDAASSPAAEDLYRSMATAGTLPVSVLTMPHPAAILVNEQTSRLEGARTGEGDEWVRVGPMKFFADGGQAMAIDARIGGERMTMGIVMDDMAAHVERAVERGWRVAVHAEGNVALGRTIEAFEAASRRRPDDDHRFRIEHAFVASKDQIAQMRQVGSVAVVQPCFVEHIGDLTGGTSFDDHSWLAFGEMAAAGVPLAASSDDPCAPFPPLWGAGKGATRTTDAGNVLEAGEALPFEDWIRAYTIGAAYAGGQEAERGSITPGKRADLVVLDGRLDPNEVPRVAETWVAGERVYSVPVLPDRGRWGSPSRVGSVAVTGTGSRGFIPPPYPYERLDALRRLADALPGGVVDCSIGTPCDPVPDAVAGAASEAAARAHGYPASAGSPAYREAAAAWIHRRLGVAVDPECVGACVGTKELVASLPQMLHLRDPGRDTVLYPAVAYPTYEMGATLAGLRAVPVPLDESWHLDLARVSASDAERALVLWVNEPGNPSGSAASSEWLAGVVGWARERGVIVASDECYVEFAPEQATVLTAGTDGVLAVHSLSKRSNMAGMRAGFYAGDESLVRYLVEVRKHAGLMVPTPVQAAATVALGDDEHVAEQRAHYAERRSIVLEGLGRHGLVHDGGPTTFYLWLRSDDGPDDGWEIAARLAHAGTLVTPGDTFGPAGADHARLALVQPVDRLAMAIERLDTAS